MCTICFATQTFDPLRHGENGPEGLMIAEGADAAEDMSTAYRINVGDSFNGTIDSDSDEDWVAVTLTAGETYQINLTGVTLSDPLMRLYDATGSQVAVNDDFGSLDSQITFTATSTGTYYIEADAYSVQTGTYELVIDEVAPPPPASVGTIDELALFLTEGYWGGREYTFNTSTSNVITVNVSGLTAEGQQLARWAMEAWEAVANIDFVEVESGEMLTFDDESSGAFAYTPGGSGSDGVEINVSRNWLTSSGTTIDSYSFQTFVHEIGHALGLGHQGDYNGNATYGRDETFTNDSWQMSVMSYFSQRENSTTNASYGFTAGPMMVDVLAIQNLYGRPEGGTATVGNTTYGLGSNLGSYMDEVFAWMATGLTTENVTGNSMVFTVYDRNGEDTFDFSYLTVDTRLDMRIGQFSDFGTRIGVMGIAPGTSIENAIVGSGNDTITGNGANNEIVSGAGDDLVRGARGADTLSGGSGQDTLLGSAGDDSLDGGDDRDVLRSDTGNDTLDGGAGNDVLDGGANDDLLSGGAGNDRMDGGDGRDTLNGGTDHDRIDGGTNHDVLNGDDGRDTLSGGDQNDTISGGAGNDLMFGGSGNDSLDGGSGFDTLDGGLGDDVLIGGRNADTFVFANDHGNDTIGDFAATSDSERIDLSAVSAINDLSDLEVGNPNGGAARQVGSDVIIETGGGSSITLTGVALADLDANDFIF